MLFAKWFEPRSVSCLCCMIVWVRVVFGKTVGKWCEPRSISCLSSVIIRVREVFRNTVGKWFEPRSVSCVSCMIVWVRVVFRKRLAVIFRIKWRVVMRWWYHHLTMTLHLTLKPSLPLRYLKPKSPPTDSLKTILTRTITQDKQGRYC